MNPIFALRSNRLAPSLAIGTLVLTGFATVRPGSAAESGVQSTPPPGFTALFNGRDLEGWWGASTEDPRKYLSLPEEELAKKKKASLKDIQEHWSVRDGVLINDGHGLYLTTDRNFRDYELLIDYKTVPQADSGIYLKGVPQVQIWDSTETSKFNIGADKGSGGLWNNSAGAPGKDPAVLADKPFGQWNHFRIVQVGGRTSVWLNDKHVVDHAMMENYFDRGGPLPPAGPIQLQTHGGEIQWRNIFVREIAPPEAVAWLRERQPEGYESIFNGKDFAGWEGPTENYKVQDGAIVCREGKGGTIYTEKEYADFSVRLQFKLPPGGNNGLALRYPGSGDTAYVGMCELQVLDDHYEKVRNTQLDPRQLHGSAYGMAAAHTGYQYPAGEWNFQVVTVKGSTIRVELNGNLILQTDLSKITDFLGDRPHPGKDRRQGHFGLAGHSDPVMFRDLAVKTLP